MTALMPTDIVPQVREVLENAARGKGSDRTSLTAYQILDRLDPAIRQRLVNERQLGGLGAGVYYAAPSVVSDAAEMIADVEIRWIDARGLSMTIGGSDIRPSFEVCALYRLP